LKGALLRAGPIEKKSRSDQYALFDSDTVAGSSLERRGVFGSCFFLLTRLGALESGESRAFSVLPL
jgi:hypothetical protein